MSTTWTLPRQPGTTPWDDPGYTREQAASDTPPALGPPAYDGYVEQVKRQLRDAGHTQVDVLTLSQEIPVTLARDSAVWGEFERRVVLADAERRADEKSLRFAVPPRFWWWQETFPVVDEDAPEEPQPAASMACWVMVVPCVPKEASTVTTGDVITTIHLDTVDTHQLARALVDADAGLAGTQWSSAVWVSGLAALPRLAAIGMDPDTDTESIVRIDGSGFHVLGRPVVVTERYTDDRVELWGERPPWARCADENASAGSRTGWKVDENGMYTVGLNGWPSNG